MFSPYELRYSVLFPLYDYVPFFFANSNPNLNESIKQLLIQLCTVLQSSQLTEIEQ